MMEYVARLICLSLATYFVIQLASGLAIAMAGARDPRTWLTPSAEPMDFFDLKGVVETLLARLNIADQVRFVPLNDDPRFHPGRAAKLVGSWELGVGGKKASSQLPTPSSQPLGVLGELHPAVRERLELDAPRAMAARAVPAARSLEPAAA